MDKVQTQALAPAFEARNPHRDRVTSHVGVSTNGGYPDSWLVFVGEHPIDMDEDWGYPYDLGNLHLRSVSWWCIPMSLQGARPLESAAKSHLFEAPASENRPVFGRTRRGTFQLAERVKRLGWNTFTIETSIVSTS